MEKISNSSADYLLQDSIERFHQENREWLSEIDLWKVELNFFQKLLDISAPKLRNEDERKQTDHFQNLIIYYTGELLDEFAQKVKRHEKYLATSLKQDAKVDDSTFRHKHGELSSHLNSFLSEFRMFKREFFKFVEPAL